MKVVYVCGYGRSGSTLLGTMLSERLGAVSVGESTHVSSEDYVRSAVCACGRSYPECSYWSRVEALLADAVGTGSPALSPGRAVLLEGLPGLLVPMSLLRRLVRRLPFSERYPGVRYPQGIRAMTAAAGGTIIDGSKTTRLTANRPRLLAASGADVSLLLVRRPLRGIVASHVAAGRRRGAGRSRARSVVSVIVGRPVADVAARVCALSLRTPLPVVRLADSLRDLEQHGTPRQGWPGDHAIAGNRRRHGVGAGEAE